MLKGFFQRLNNWQINLLIFFILVFIVGWMQYLLLGIVLNYGFTPDDWGLLLFYKELGDNPFSKIAYVWSVKGAYTTSQVYFIGLLNDFFGLNYQAYQITNIIFKTLATLSLFPLILIVFKRKLLAFLTTILYGMSYMSSRSLEYVVKGTDYLAIIPMNVFLIIYYYILTKKVKKWWAFILMSVFWFISLMISPIRIYPVLVLIPLIEFFLWIQQKSVNSAANSFKRLLVLYAPFLIVYFYKPSSILAFLQNPKALYQTIQDGNWHIILTPFQGVGLSVSLVEHMNKVFGSFNFSEAGSYIIFLLGGPLIVFGISTIFLSIVKFKNRLRFFIVTLSINFLLDIIFYYLAIHELSIPENLRLHFDPARMYPILIASFMLSVSFASFLEWRSLGKKDDLLLALWVSPPIILLYTFLIWIFAPFGIGFEGQQGYYLVIPTIATSLFLSAILTGIYDKTLNQKNRISKFFIICIILTILFYMYSLNRNSIYYFFNSAGINGRLASDQERMYNQLLSNLGNNFKKGEAALFYFDVSEDGQRGTFYTESLLLSLANRLHIENEGDKGCVGVFYQDILNLEKLVVVKDGIRGFIYSAHCGELFYKTNDFYAFKLKNGEIIDTKKEVLKNLGFN